MKWGQNIWSFQYVIILSEKELSLQNMYLLHLPWQAPAFAHWKHITTVVYWFHLLWKTRGILPAFSDVTSSTSVCLGRSHLVHKHHQSSTLHSLCPWSMRCEDGGHQCDSVSLSRMLHHSKDSLCLCPIRCDESLWPLAIFFPLTMESAQFHGNGITLTAVFLFTLKCIPNKS